MKIRISACLFAMVVALVASKTFAQDCAPCAAASDVSCASCAPCASCTGASCELFGGLRSLLACRPCVTPCTIVPTCTTCAPAPAPSCTTCGPVAPTCGPIVSSNLPSCGCDAAPSCGCDAIPAPSPCCGPMFPYLKPCLYNAVHRPINGVCKLVHGAFCALAEATTPSDDCGFFQPAYIDVSCGSCATCGAVDVAPAPCGPATPSCK